MSLCLPTNFSWLPWKCLEPFIPFLNIFILTKTKTALFIAKFLKGTICIQWLGSKLGEVAVYFQGKNPILTQSKF